ncbi:MAG TPA: DUF349 domain-containing protein [Marinobacter sp.]|nr:DUF349 domain-containing protein [Marinobacter sp.]
MAAFIQKLFRSRKNSSIPAPAQAKAKAENNGADNSSRNERELLRESQESQLQAAPSQAELAGLAIAGVTATIRLSAADRLEDEALLQSVQKQAKSRDKSVYQSVRQRLQSIRDAQAAETALQERIQALIQHAEDQARTEDTKLYEARLDALLENWRAVEPRASAEQTAAFLAATHECRERVKEHKRLQEEEARHQEQARQRTETLALLQNTLTDLRKVAPDELPSAGALDALQKTQENRWLEATRATPVSKQEQKSYEQNMLGLRSYLAAVRRLEDMKASLAELAEIARADEATDEQRQTARQLMKELDWPADFPRPARLEPLRKLAGKASAKRFPAADTDPERSKALLDALKATLPDLEAALEARQYKESKQLLKIAQSQFQQLDSRHKRGLQPRMQLLAGQFRELSDWQGFATEPKQVSLCEQMEYLAEQPMEPEAKAERIKELQNEWRELGGSSDRALWARFKAASDKAYEPCKAYFEAKSDLKQANLRKREEICDQLTAFIAQADWQTIDWKGAERIHQTARQEWKSAWPVDFRNNRSVQKRFDDLLRRLEQPLDEERKKNEALKQDIVDKARALVHHEPLAEAMAQAKALQNEWKAVGITRHREDRKLWQAFRAACDEIFERRDTQRSARQEASEQADQAAREVIVRLESSGAPEDSEALASTITSLNELAGSPVSKAIRAQLNDLRAELIARQRSRALRREITEWQTLVTTRVDAGCTGLPDAPAHWHDLIKGQAPTSGHDLVIRAEILSGADTPEHDQARRMEIQVQRLTAGMGNSEPESSDAELERLLAMWCLHPEADGITAERAQRLNRALETLLSKD